MTLRILRDRHGNTEIIACNSHEFKWGDLAPSDTWQHMSSRSLCGFSAVPSRLLREITTSRSTPRTCPSLFTSAESFVGKTATWSPESYLKIQQKPWPWAKKHLQKMWDNQTDLILEPVMSSSRCMRCLSPPLLSLRFKVTGARKGFFESNGLKRTKAIFEK